ncbi:MAG: hypothetical protein IJA61_00635 [Clostridia bacterium]|nr:hypothetical protein [Clostridia bacterium]
MNLCLIDKPVANGVYIEGYLCENVEKLEYNIHTLKYKCYIPYTGKVAKVPEMSRYFFFNQINGLDISKIFLLSREVEEFITDDIIYESEFIIKGYLFVRCY